MWYDWLDHKEFIAKVENYTRQPTSKLPKIKQINTKFPKLKETLNLLEQINNDQ